jgi:hypothetical protein
VIGGGCCMQKKTNSQEGEAYLLNFETCPSGGFPDNLSFIHFFNSPHGCLFFSGVEGAKKFKGSIWEQ